MNEKMIKISVERIEQAIFLIRGQKVLLDADLAQLYGVETKILNKAVKRNLDRFPEDFMFQLTAEEAENLRFQIGTSKKQRGGRRYLPYAFTEQGVAMLSGVLNSPRAVKVNVEIMRAFVQLRQLMATHTDLACKLTALEQKYDEQSQFQNVSVCSISRKAKILTTGIHVVFRGLKFLPDAEIGQIGTF